MSQLFASGGQNIGASASASVLPENTQGLQEASVLTGIRAPTATTSEGSVLVESLGCPLFGSSSVRVPCWGESGKYCNFIWYLRKVESFLRIITPGEISVLVD